MVGLARISHNTNELKIVDLTWRQRQCHLLFQCMVQPRRPNGFIDVRGAVGKYCFHLVISAAFSVELRTQRKVNLQPTPPKN